MRRQRGASWLFNSRSSGAPRLACLLLFHDMDKRNCAYCGREYAPDRANRRFCALTCSSNSLADRRRRPLADRFWEKVSRGGSTDECWGWNGARHLHGYGIILEGGRGSVPIGAHRASWLLHNGPIPDGLWVLHKCDNPPCCNPEHLFLGTVKDNSVDCARKGRVRGGMPKGKNRGAVNVQAKLTDAAVLAIREEYASGRATYYTLAEQHGVTSSTIGLIVRGVHWCHVGGPRTRNWTKTRCQP
jgi:hypothetical protein